MTASPEELYSGFIGGTVIGKVFQKKSVPVDEVVLSKNKEAWKASKAKREAALSITAEDAVQAFVSSPQEDADEALKAHGFDSKGVVGKVIDIRGAGWVIVGVLKPTYTARGKTCKKAHVLEIAKKEDVLASFKQKRSGKTRALSNVCVLDAKNTEKILN
jgi:hypothetical protein